MQRFLDAPPDSFRFTRLETEQDFGLYGAVKSAYAEHLDESAEVGILRVGNTALPVDPRCVAMLKAVLTAGCCLIEERAVACRKVFGKCVVCPTPNEFLPTLKELASGDVWIKDIYRAAEEAWE